MQKNIFVICFLGFHFIQTLNCSHKQKTALRKQKAFIKYNLIVILSIASDSKTIAFIKIGTGKYVAYRFDSSIVFSLQDLFNTQKSLKKKKF